MKGLLRDDTGANVSLVKIQSRSNVEETTCIYPRQVLLEFYKRPVFEQDES